MQDDSTMGCLAVVMNIILFFITGTISYNLVEPHSFFGVLFFLIVWSIVHFIGQYVMAFLLAGLLVVLGRS
ncbi:hypothetical protein [Psychrobacter phenylpyruvicus]|uniref:Uncharacterized protein n=1 Tax=Psychrobacter phenylpyruvicus TaxID=29432 RepID=A0A379LLV5_9GAMM|nr:hypothetical protein [Psychrobacter phenylpyruvicus]SUD90877.1 Uncharacterised protein [Psychrobacter phenylpyruvicus]